MLDCTEYNMQVAVAQYLDMRGLLWMHPANERQTTPQNGARLKRAGVKPGVPDILVFEPFDAEGEAGATVMFAGLALELKTPRGYASPQQRAWLTALEERGWLTAVCRSVDDALEIIRGCYPEGQR